MTKVEHRNPATSLGFAIVHHVITRDMRISHGAYRLYAHYLEYAQQSGEAWPGRDTVAGVFGVDVATISRWNAELIDAGLITRQRRMSRTSMTYIEEVGSIAELVELALAVLSRRKNATSVVAKMRHLTAHPCAVEEEQVEEEQVEQSPADAGKGDDSEGNSSGDSRSERGSERRSGSDIQDQQSTGSDDGGTGRSPVTNQHDGFQDSGTALPARFVSEEPGHTQARRDQPGIAEHGGPAVQGSTERLEEPEYIDVGDDGDWYEEEKRVPNWKLPDSPLHDEFLNTCRSKRFESKQKRKVTAIGAAMEAFNVKLQFVGAYDAYQAVIEAIEPLEELVDVPKILPPTWWRYRLGNARDHKWSKKILLGALLNRDKLMEHCQYWLREIGRSVDEKTRGSDTGRSPSLVIAEEEGTSGLAEITAEDAAAILSRS